MPVTEMGTPSTVLTWLESTLMVITLSTILYMVSVAAIEKKLSQNLPQGTSYYWQHLQLAEKSHDMASQINWLFAEYTIFSPSSLIPKESYVPLHMLDPGPDESPSSGDQKGFAMATSCNSTEFATVQT